MKVFPRATSLLKGATFIDFWFLKNFLRIFNFLFLWLCIKEWNYLLFKRGLRLCKELCLLFLPNVPGVTSIPDSRGLMVSKVILGYDWFCFDQIKTNNKFCGNSVLVVSDFMSSHIDTTASSEIIMYQTVPRQIHNLCKLREKVY